MVYGFYHLICFCSYMLMVRPRHEKTDSRFDIVIALEESTDWPRWFIHKKLFSMFKNIGQGPEQTQFGIVFCGLANYDQATTLNKCSDLKCLKDKVKSPAKKAYPYKWGDCLNVVGKLFDPQKGDREDAANVVFAVTTGLDRTSYGFEDIVQDLVTFKKATTFALHTHDATTRDFWEESLIVLLKLAYNVRYHVVNMGWQHDFSEGVDIVELLKYTVGASYFPDCYLSQLDLACAFINGSCTKVREWYVQVTPHKKGNQCPDPLPPNKYITCPESECGCLNLEFFEEPDCPKINCNNDLRVNISSNVRMPTECTLKYTWVTCPYNCPTMDETERTLIIVLVISVVLMVVVLTALAFLVYCRQKRIAEKGYDSTTFTLGSKTPSTSKVTTARGVVPVPVIDDSEKSSGRSSRSKKPIKRYYHPESETSAAKKKSKNVQLKESKSIGSPSLKVSSAVTKSPKSNITSVRKNGKTSSAIVPTQPSKTGSYKGKEVANVLKKQSGTVSPISNVSKGSHRSPVSKLNINKTGKV